MLFLDATRYQPWNGLVDVYTSTSLKASVNAHAAINNYIPRLYRGYFSLFSRALSMCYYPLYLPYTEPDAEYLIPCGVLVFRVYKGFAPMAKPIFLGTNAIRSERSSLPGARGACNRLETCEVTNDHSTPGPVINVAIK